MKNKGDITPPKNHNNFLVLIHKDMEIYDIPNKEVKIGVLRQLNDLQQHKEGQLNKIGKTIHNQNEKFDKERKIIL